MVRYKFFNKKSITISVLAIIIFTTFLLKIVPVKEVTYVLKTGNIVLYPAFLEYFSIEVHKDFLISGTFSVNADDDNFDLYIVKPSDFMVVGASSDYTMIENTNVSSTYFSFTADMKEKFLVLIKNRSNTMINVDIHISEKGMVTLF